uniref:Teneurin transmembrane protein 3 n=1 Tax=Electrophorus electricus TaxID=8005 RepID=A0A4W4ELM0_ELEEL
MEVKEHRLNCSLSRGPGERRLPATSVLTQKSYSSSETLKAFDHMMAFFLCLYMVLIGLGDLCFSILAGQTLSLRQLGLCSGAPRRGLSFCAETGLSHHVQPSGADHVQNIGGISPDCASRLWGRGIKLHGRDSRLSSQSNSALTLTDAEQDDRSEHDSGKCSFTCVVISVHPGACWLVVFRES